MMVFAPPAGYERVDVAPLLKMRAIEAFNRYAGSSEQLDMVRRNRLLNRHIDDGVEIANGDDRPAVHHQPGLDAEYIERVRQAEEDRNEAAQAIVEEAGVADPRDLRLMVQLENFDGRITDVEVYRPIIGAAEDEPPMRIRMGVPNGLPETAEPSLLSLEGSSSSSASQGLSGGQIAGITVGSVAGASLIVAAIIFWRRRRNSSKSSCPSEPRLV